MKELHSATLRKNRKSRERVAQCDLNDGMMEQSSNELITLGNSTPSASSNGKSGFVSEGHQHQSQSARDHIKFPEFAEWCHSKRDRRGNPGIPTDAGFWKWLLGQRPQWRNKVRQNPDGKEGYVLDTKFFTNAEATQLGLKDPKVIEKFRKAVLRRNGQIKTL